MVFHHRGAVECPGTYETARGSIHTSMKPTLKSVSVYTVEEYVALMLEYIATCFVQCHSGTDWLVHPIQFRFGPNLKIVLTQ